MNSRFVPLTICADPLSHEASMIVSVSSDVERIQELPEPDRQKELASLPYEIEKKIAKELGIKGSLPHEIRDWVISVRDYWP